MRMFFPKIWRRRALGAGAALLSALGAAGLLGCAEEVGALSPAAEASGKLEFALGAEVHHFELADATCTPFPDSSGEDERPAQFWMVSAPAAFKAQIDDAVEQPVLLNARLPPGLFSAPKTSEQLKFGREQVDFGAVASAINIEFFDETHKTLQMLAHAARDIAPYQCQVGWRDPEEDASSALVLSCNQARVFPWASAHQRPEGSFRATFRCGEPDRQPERSSDHGDAQPG